MIVIVLYLNIIDIFISRYVLACEHVNELMVSTPIGKPEYPIVELLTKKCCSRTCVTCFRKLSAVDIEDVRKRFYSLPTETSQNQLVIDYLIHHSDCSRSADSISFCVAGKTVCKLCWRMCYGIKYTRFNSLIAKFQSGILQIEHGRQGLRSCRDSTVRATSWLRIFVDKVGDRMPTDGTIHLPSCLTKSDVYNLAQEDLSQGGVPMCSRSSFFRLWKNDFKHVKIPPVSSNRVTVYSE